MQLPISRLAAAGIGFGTSGVRAKVDALTDRVCVAYTLAFLEHLSRTTGKPPHPDPLPRLWPGEREELSRKPAETRARRVALGHDLRPSSPRIASACATAARMAGWDVAFVGAIPTPALAHYAIQKGIPAIVVTGSHIPFDRNGIKFYASTGEILKADEAAISAATVELDDAAFEGDALRDPAPLPPPDPAGEELFVERYLGFFPAGMLEGRRIGVYQHSSVARDLIARTLAALGADVVAFGRTDTFVPVDTEAVSDADQRNAHAWAAEHRLDAIVSTDGDADRPLVSDEAGTWFRGDIVGMLCAGYLGAQTVVTPVSSNTAVDRWGKFRKVVRTRIGSPFVIDEMNAAVRAGEHPVAGYEANGGFLLASPVERPGPEGRSRRLEALPTRDAMLPILSVLAMASERGVPVSGVMAGLPARFTRSDRLQEFDTALSRDLLARLAADPAVLGGFFAPVGEIADVNRVDGLRVTLGSGDIVHLRPSGNAPELRCYAEADTPARAGELCAWGLRAAAEAARSRG